MRKRACSHAFNKKGDAVLDGLTVIVLLVVFAILGVIGSSVFDELNAGLNSTGVSPEAVATAEEQAEGYNPLIDGMFLFIFVMFIVFAVISAFVIDTNPIYFVVSLILLIFVFIVGGILANTYNDLASDSVLAVYANNLPTVSLILDNFLVIGVVVGFVILIALFIKIKM